MKRKVNQVGKNTMTVSLPVEWVKEKGIKKGDELELTPHGELLCIGYEGVKRDNVSLSVVGLSGSSIKSIISILYKSGCDELTMSYGKKEELETIQNTINQMLIGFEIVGNSQKVCTIRDVSIPKKDLFPSLLKRNFMVAQTLAKETLDNLEKFEVLEETAFLEITNNKLTNFCHRMLNMYSFKGSHYLYVILWNLESICDDFRDICDKYSKLSFSTSPSLKKLLEQVLKVMKLHEDLFYNYDLSSFENFCVESNKLVFEIEKFKSSQKEKFLLSKLAMIAERLNDSFGSLSGHHWASIEGINDSKQG